MLLELVQHAPDIFFLQSPTFSLTFRACMEPLTGIHTETVFAALDIFRIILDHDCLAPRPSPPPKFPLYANAIRTAINNDGHVLVGYLLTGLVGDFPEDSTSSIISIFRALSAVWGSQLVACLPAVLQQLPASTAPHDAKTQFLADVTG